VAGRFSQPRVSRQKEVRIKGISRIRSLPFLGLVLLGLLASGFAGVLPDLFRFLLALSVLTWIPGAVLVGGVLPVRVRGPLERFVLWFTAGKAAVSLVVWLCVIAGVSFDACSLLVQWTLAVYYAVMTIRGLDRARAPVRIGGPGLAGLPGTGHQRTLLGVAVVMVVFALLHPAPIQLGQDAPDHIGYLRHIGTENCLEPQGVLAPPVDADGGPKRFLKPDPRKGTIHPLVAVAARMAAVEPEVAWPTYATLLFPVAFLSFCWFCSVFLPRRSLVLACAALFLMFQGGSGFLHGAEAANGRNLALQFYWILSPLCLLYVAQPDKKLLACLLLVFAGGAAAHIGVAMHFVVLLATLFVFQRWFGMNRRAVATLCLAGVVVAAAVLAWKLVHTVGGGNLIHTHPNRLMFFDERFFTVSPVYVLRRHSMVYLGGLMMIPFLLAARRHREAQLGMAYAAIPCLLCFVPPVTLLAFRFASYMTFRSLLNMPVFAALTAAVWFLVVWSRRRSWPARLFVALLLIVWSMIFVVPGLNGFRSELSVQMERTARPSVFARHTDLIEFLRSRPNGSVVLSDPKTSYIISAATDHRVVAVPGPHGNPNDPDALDRLAAIRDVLSPFVLHSKTVAACERYGVDFVVVNARITRDPDEFLMDWDPSLFAATAAKIEHLDTRFRPVFETQDCRVYVYYPGPIPPDRWFPESTPVSFDAGHIHECRVRYPDLGVDIVEVMVTPEVVLPGETVEITLGYYKEDAIEYGLPFNLYVRFDHESLFENNRRYPGEKLVRRFRERRGGYLLRYRSDLRPFSGVFTPDQWPIGAKFYEKVTVGLPPTLKPGRYRVEFKLEHDSMMANFALSDILYNRDHYSGSPCFEIDVTRQVVR
jgi:hypothetical protein